MASPVAIQKSYLFFSCPALSSAVASSKRDLAANTLARSEVRSCESLEISWTTECNSFWTSFSSSVRPPMVALSEMFSAWSFWRMARSLTSSSDASPMWYESLSCWVVLGTGAGAGAAAEVGAGDGAGAS